MDSNSLFFIIIAILFICFFAGRRAGLIRAMIPVASSLLSFCLLASVIPIFKADITDQLSSFLIKDALVSLTAFIVTFFLFRWLIKTVLRFFRILGDSPVIGTLNKILGGVAGFAGGLIIIWGSFFFILLFYGPQGLPVFFTAVNGNEFVKMLYNNNLIMTLINYFIFAA
ncbi:MAG: CvpA family protein [Lachnospiraceae bacterium]|nr:CvpA family protein [Lachnospiraceae bacterium]